MNVWIVNHYAIPPSMGGLVRHYYFSKYLQKKGHSVKILTSGRIHNTDINMIGDDSLYCEKDMDGVEYTFVKSRSYKGNGMDRIANMIDFPFKIWKTMKHFLKKEKPDVIYTSSPDLFVSLFAVVFAKKYKIPIVLEIRDLWPESIVYYRHMSEKNPIIMFLYQLEKWIYKKADRLIFTFQGGKNYVRDKKWEKSVSLDKICYVNNGVDLVEFNQNKSKYVWKDELLERNDIFKVVYVGSIRLVNHLEDLVDAAKVIKERGIENITFLIYGDGTEREILEKRCKEERLNVFFRGRVEKKYVPYILSRANLNVINVQKSGLVRYGCSWNKLFEYIASERPILSNLPTEYDLIKEHGLGVSKLFANGTEYAEEIIRISQMEQEEYETYCVQSAQVAREYDYQRLTEKIEAIFNEVVRKEG